MRTSISRIATIAVTILTVAAWQTDADVARAGEAAGSSSDWAPAEREDMQIFAPYIGRWITEPRTSATGDEIQIIVEYSWFDANQTVAKLIISRREVGATEEVLQWEGFYGVHPTENRIYYYGVNVAGVSAFGGVHSFNSESGEREVFLRGGAPDGQPVAVKDAFSLVDDSSWRSVTELKRGDDEWRTISDDVYTRMTD